MVASDSFFVFDLVVGFSLPIYVHLRNRSRADGVAVVRLFWLGVAIGLSWEIPIFLSALLATDPIVEFIREPPAHLLAFLAAHACWDGGLFLAGLGLVQALCPMPVFESFRWRELGVLVAWGQVSELAVEVVSIWNGGWVYSREYAWNPVLFEVAGHPVTLVPQLIWLAAPVVYYLCVLRFIRRAQAAG